MKRLIIARHGNTFLPDETPTRVGRRTDLPLVETALATNIGHYLLQQDISLNAVYAAPLKRTYNTAKLILVAMGVILPINSAPDFLEIDYGPDENQPETEVIARLGRAVLCEQGQTHPSHADITAAGKKQLQEWNNRACVPSGWHVDPNALIRVWQQFADAIPNGETALVVSSNGVIRFAPHILSKDNYCQFIQQHSLKMRTGAIAIFDYYKGHWKCKVWDKRPENVKND